MDIKRESRRTQLAKPLIADLGEMRLAEVQTFIAEDLKHYHRLPKGGCKEYVTKLTIEDALRIIIKQERYITKKELHDILHDHIERAVPNEKYRQYTPLT